MRGTLALYRQILRSARRFPSIKRDKLIEEIRSGFRSLQNESDSKKIDAALQVATKGLIQLQQFSNLSQSHSAWEVHLDSNPLPRSEKKN